MRELDIILATYPTGDSVRRTVRLTESDIKYLSGLGKEDLFRELFGRFGITDFRSYPGLPKGPYYSINDEVYAAITSLTLQKTEEAAAKHNVGGVFCVRYGREGDQDEHAVDWNWKKPGVWTRSSRESGLGHKWEYNGDLDDIAYRALTAAFSLDAQQFPVDQVATMSPETLSKAGDSKHDITILSGNPSIVLGDIVRQDDERPNYGLISKK